MRNIIVSVLTCLLLFSLSFAVWSESIDIHAIDAKGRPISNASVSVVYQSYFCGKHDILELTTNSAGIAHANFVNNVLEEGVYPPCVERQYTVRASYMGTTNETVGIVGKQSSYYVALPVAEYRLNVKDAGNQPLYPITLLYGSQKIESSTGVFVLELPTNQEFTLNISYFRISNLTRVNLKEDNSTDFILPVYDLHIKLFNDAGERVKGQIKIANTSLNQWSLLTEDAVFENFPFAIANFTVIIDNTERQVEKKIDSENIVFYIDMTPPVIRDVTQTAVSGTVRVSASVSDEGSTASGLASNPILQYVFNDTTDWIVMKMYPKSAKIFEGEIPADNKNVVYQIIAKDKQGNEEIYDGRYDFKPTTKPPGSGKIPTLQEIFSALTSNISLPHVIGVVIFIFIIFLVYRKIKEVV